MRKSWLVCALLGTLAWGQAQPGTSPGTQQNNAPAQALQPRGMAMQQAGGAAPPSTAEVGENAAVITIHGLCPPAPRTAASKEGTSKTGTSAAKKPADCKTVITRAGFEKITKALQQGPNPLNPQQKRQLATVLPRIMVMSEAAKSKGLDKTDHFTEMVKFAKMQILTQELQRELQEQADKITPQNIEDYYKKNPEAYQQFSFDRVFIPRYKQEKPDSKEDEKQDEKLTEEQEKAKETADKAKQEQGEQEMDKMAESLRAKASQGEDFVKLQKEAFEAAGMKMDSPTVNLPKVRHTGLPPAQASAFDLKVGEVSAVISDNGGHYVYKMLTKEVLPLDQVKEEIHNNMKTQRLKDLMDKYQNSYHTDTNEEFFGPAPAQGQRMGMPPQMPRPQGVAPSAQPQGAPAHNTPAQPTPPPSSPQQPPASQPN